MPKIIELTVEIDIHRVTCPGVWLCQDGRVSLTVFSLGTSYQTCLLPPLFPLTFKDVFYFQKRFQETCALNNICCLLKDETIYCELVQWSEDCGSGECILLAQYLGALSDVLLPPNMCSSDGVDLLMRRSKDFPGILSPKIEIATKVRIDEVWNQQSMTSPIKPPDCRCKQEDSARQKQVCHSAQYHRNKCYTYKKLPSARSRSRSRSRSGSSRSCSSLRAQDCARHHANVKETTGPVTSRCPSPINKSRLARCPSRKSHAYCLYNIQTDQRPTSGSASENIRSALNIEKSFTSMREDDRQKTIIESHYIDHMHKMHTKHNEVHKHIHKGRINPCTCEICKRYHELFHSYQL